MDKLIKVLHIPEDEKKGIYKLLYQHSDITYEAHVTFEEYKVRLLKQKLVFKNGYSKDDIEEFEDAVRDMANKENIYDTSD